MLPFLLTRKGKINYILATYLKARSTKKILNLLKSVYQKYIPRGFDITDGHGDNEFNVHLLLNDLLPINMHVYAKDQHLGIA